MADVFISYSRRDQAFALQLVGALASCGSSAWLDQTNVFPAGAFREDIQAGIEEAGAFLFLLSPDSIVSEECGKELEYAQACGKKLIPVLHRAVDPSDAPEALQELAWIEDASFDRLVEQVLVSLLTDKDDWKQSGKWLRVANEWDKNHRHHASLLLRGQELKKAEDWLKRAEHWRLEESRKKPQPLPLHIQFIRESRRAANRFLLVSILALLLLIGFTGAGAFLLLYHDPTLVTSLNDEGQGSLRQIITTAKRGSTITFAPSVRGTILLTGDLSITQNLTLRGPGAGALIISGGNKSFKVRVFQGISISIFGLAFKNSAGILNEGTLTLTNSTVSDNVSRSTSISDLTLSGAGINNLSTGTLTISNSIVSGNKAGNYGAGIWNGGKLTLSSSTVSNNTVGQYGGGIYNALDATMTIMNSTISGNVAQNDGGGIMNDLDATATITKSTISGNTVDGGGGNGGGILNRSKLILTDSTVFDNTVKEQEGSTFSQPGSRDDGGGILNDPSGQLILTSSTISGNTAQDGGGGICDQGILTLTNSTVSDNMATSGGGLLIQGLTYASVYANKATTAQADLTFNTLSRNSAHNGSEIAIEDDHIEGNGSGTPIAQMSHVKIRNSIVAGDPTRPDLAGMLTSSGYNLFQDNSGATFDPATGTQHGTDKILSTNDLSRLFTDPMRLQNNGGPTQTLAQAPGSPALDQIPLAACHINGITTDQRGMKRPDENESACDIGAYEQAGQQ